MGGGCARGSPTWIQSRLQEEIIICSFMVHNHIRIDGPPLWTGLLCACRGMDLWAGCWVWNRLVQTSTASGPQRTLQLPRGEQLVHRHPRGWAQLTRQGRPRPRRGLAKMRPQTQPPAWVTAGAPHEARISPHIGRQATSIQHQDLGGPRPFLMKSIEKNFLHGTS